MRSLKDKRFRYGTFSTIMMLFAVVLFVLVNLLAGEFNRSRDLTAEQIFTLSAQSHNFLAGLDTDVRITYLAATGEDHFFHHIISALLDEYASGSPHVSVDVRDPMLNPALVHQLAASAGLEVGIPPFSVVVESGGETRVVTLSDMVQQEVVNPFTGQSRIVGFMFEPAITRAMHIVTQGAPPIIYYVIGSGEPDLPQPFISFLESENFLMRQVNLVLEDVPEDADVLFIPTPMRDWTEVKADRVLAFLEAEGRAFFSVDFTFEYTPNFDRVLAAYGVRISDHIILEGDSRNIFMDSPYFILPTTIGHEITENLQVRNFANLVVFTTGVEVLDLRRASTTIEPLWMTTGDSFARVDIDNPSFARIPGDIDGPFNLAVAITDRLFHIDTEFRTQLVVVGNMQFLDPGLTGFIGAGNWHFVLNSLRWMQGQPPSIWIPGRPTPGDAPLMLSQYQQNVISGIAMGGIPLICVAIGVFIWFRRRHS